MEIPAQLHGKAQPKPVAEAGVDLGIIGLLAAENAPLDGRLDPFLPFVIAAEGEAGQIDRRIHRGIGRDGLRRLLDRWLGGGGRLEVHDVEHLYRVELGHEHHLLDLGLSRIDQFAGKILIGKQRQALRFRGPDFSFNLLALHRILQLRVQVCDILG